MWFSILKAVLGIASAISSYMESKQLLDAGAAKALKETYEDALEKITKAQRARNSVVHDDDSVLSDKQNRDNRR